MFTIALIDQDEGLLEKVSGFLQSKIYEKKTIEKYTEENAFLYDLDEGKQFDLYILETKLRKISGIDLAKSIRAMHQKAKIIFLTAYKTFAFDSYDLEVQAYQYILKSQMKEKLPPILKQILKELGKEKFYAIYNRRRLEKISCGSILYLHKEGKNVTIKTEEREYKERKSLEQLMQDLDMDELISVDRSYCVNIRHVKNIIGNIVVVDSGEELIMSRSKIHRVKKKVLEQWCKENLSLRLLNVCAPFLSKEEEEEE